MPATLTAFVAGVLLLQQGAELPSGALIAAIAACSLVLAAAALALRPTAAPWRRRSACTAALLAGVAYAGWMAQLRLADQLGFADEGRDLEVIGVVAALPSQAERGVRFAFDVQRVMPAQVHVPARISLAWYEPRQAPRPAEQWRFTVRLRRPHGNFNPAGFDGELWMLEQSIRASGYVRDGPTAATPLRLQPTVWHLNALIDRLRGDLRARMQLALQQRRYAGVIIALVMGDQGLIAPGDWTLFNRTGISHLVSISGLHITMIAALLALAAGAAWRRSARLLAICPLQPVRAAAGTVGALLYCLLAGWGVPAQRTFVMLATVAAAMVFRTRLDGFTVLAAAAAVVCLWDPWSVLAPGFWLSFGAVACIFYSLGPRLAPLAKGAHLVRALREAVRVQAAVTIGLVPLTLVLFAQISPVSPLANALAIPLVSYLVTPLALVGAAAVATGDALAPAGAVLLVLSHALFDCLAGALTWMVQLPYAWVAFPPPPIWAVALAAAGIAWLLAPAGWPLRWVGVTWLLPALVWPPERPGVDSLWVTALDVGQGMALVLETQREVLVFDTGPRLGEDIDAGARVIVPYLRSRGIDRVSMLVISHLDADHSGGAQSLIQSIRVDRVLTSIPADSELLRGVPDLVRCEQGQRFAVGTLQVEVLSPPAELYQRAHATTNASSCVLRARLGPTRVLLTGDVPARQEAGMVAAFGQGLEAQLMVAPHHGSRTSSSEAFIQTVRPRWASVQAGYRSRFGHPHQQVLLRYRQAGVQVVRSDWVGAARWRFDAGGSARLEQWRLDHGRYWLNQPSRRSDPAAPPEPPESAGDTISP